MDPPRKILIVGEKMTGKSSLIQIFKDYEQICKSSTESTAGGSRNVSPNINTLSLGNDGFQYTDLNKANQNNRLIMAISANRSIIQKE
jgi:hypothetical protein